MAESDIRISRRQCILRIAAVPGNGQRQAETMNLRVQCHARQKTDDSPVRFQLGEREYLIEEVLDQWYGPDGSFFKVRADDGNLYLLRHDSASGEWKLESFRRL